MLQGMWNLPEPVSPALAHGFLFTPGKPPEKVLICLAVCALSAASMFAGHVWLWVTCDPFSYLPQNCAAFHVTASPMCWWTAPKWAISSSMKWVSVEYWVASAFEARNGISSVWWYDPLFFKQRMDLFSEWTINLSADSDLVPLWREKVRCKF